MPLRNKFCYCDHVPTFYYGCNQQTQETDQKTFLVYTQPLSVLEQRVILLKLLDPKASLNATLVVVVVISSLNTQCSATQLCVHILAHIPYRSAVSDF